jgi:hypothetical protein
MQRGNESASSPSAASFASLLGSLTAPKQPGKWNDDDLADDVATLSYESALRAHARYRTPDRTDRSLTQAAPADSDRIDSYELAPVDDAMEDQSGLFSGAKARTDFGAFAAPMRKRSAQALKSRPVTKQVSARSTAGSRPVAKQVPTRSSGAVSNPVTKPGSHDLCDAPSRSRTVFEKNLKDASITIRMSREECDQLHRRAAEAGLTVSAYLRSCTFEAESLRALVKDTMAQLKAAKSTEKPMPHPPARRSLGGQLIRFITPWRSGWGAVRA